MFCFFSSNLTIKRNECLNLTNNRLTIKKIYKFIFISVVATFLFFKNTINLKPPDKLEILLSINHIKHVTDK